MPLGGHLPELTFLILVLIIALIVYLVVRAIRPR